MDALAEEISTGTPIVVLEPSCASVFRDEAVNLMPDDPRTAKLKRQTMMLSEILKQHAPDYAPAKTQQKILVHMHCHHRAIFNMKDEVASLAATGGEVKVLDSGCCGMAGPFGFEKKSYGVSQTLGERVLLPPCGRPPIGHRDGWLQLPRADCANIVSAPSSCGSFEGGST